MAYSWTPGNCGLPTATQKVDSRQVVFRIFFKQFKEHCEDIVDIAYPMSLSWRIYLHRKIPAPRGQMKIDFLLNPSKNDEGFTEEGKYEHRNMPYWPASLHRMMYCMSGRNGDVRSPDCRSSPTQILYRPYQECHNISSNAKLTKMTPMGNESGSGSPYHIHSHGHQQSANEPPHRRLLPKYRYINELSRNPPESYRLYKRHDPLAYRSTKKSSHGQAPRPKYEEEEMYFIWYQRVDLSQDWNEVHERFNRQFPNRQRHGFQGLQCKFYRFIKEKKCPTLRQQLRIRYNRFLPELGLTKAEYKPSKFGVRQWANVWYPWMCEDEEMKAHHALKINVMDS